MSKPQLPELTPWKLPEEIDSDSTTSNGETDAIPFVLEGKDVTAVRNAAMTIKTPEYDIFFLEAMRDQSRREIKDCTNFGGLLSVVADKILELGVKDGSRLSLAISSVIARSLRQRDTRNYEETLAHSYQRLRHEEHRSNKMMRGLQLGDLGLRTASGYGDTSRAFSGEAAKTYAERMALTGYHTALELAENSKGASATAVIESVPPLIDNSHAVVKVMTAIHDEITRPPFASLLISD